MHSRVLPLTLLLTFAAISFAWARLGETEAQILQRYGKAAYHVHHPWGDEEGFSMGGFSIAVTFIDGVSRGELYRLAGGHITDEMEVSLLNANSEGYPWDDRPQSEWPVNTWPRVKGMWERPNGSTAVLTDISFEFKSIYLITAQEEAAKQKPPQPTTQGF